ncbi:serine threonine- kinase PLK1 [Labeo rohita]|uniref:Serine/threonine-protein kinase PLK1 n=1 Tax=Labeo rohita TaxID=84645 RepID=A0A498LLV7_LABRO|nr:serine threonine- kinase PLK1 [Labeo rohita]
MSAGIPKTAKPSSHVDPKSAPLKEIPDVLVDPRTMKRYMRGRFLGKGGFAKCYEITDMDTKEVFAGKVVPKSMLLKPHQKEKMSTEIAIHKSLDNPHVVGFHGFFEDDDFVYVVLEICDFGLATKIEFDGERKKTLCGTPNYIAPEVLCKKGHSFEVDVWSLGCILYTLLVGKPPFETSCLKETYIRIKKNEYVVPRHINPVAAALIRRMLHADPTLRPSVSDLLADEFFTSGYAPLRLPTSCLTVPPRFSIAPSSLDPALLRKPLSSLNKGTDSPIEKMGKMEQPQREDLQQRDGPEQPDTHLSDMLQQLASVNTARPSERDFIRQEEAEDPACIPIFWISKWVDYSDKYGLVCFVHVKWITGKHITLLKYFRNYMSEHLLKAGANITPRDGDELTRLPYLRHWFRTKSAIVLHLSNGTVQINFFQDHTKLILCPLMGAVTYINEKREFYTYKMSLIEEFGCCKELASRLRYARNMVEKLMACKSTAAATTSAR